MRQRRRRLLVPTQMTARTRITRRTTQTVMSAVSTSAPLKRAAKLHKELNDHEEIALAKHRKVPIGVIKQPLPTWLG
jgi:hypothetical protein